MYPTDAQTERVVNNTNTMINSFSVFPSATKTILNITINSQSATANNIVYCGADIYFRQRGNGVFFSENLSKQCFSTVTADIDKNSTILITYVPYNLALKSTSTVPVIIDNGVTVSQGFTYGEIMIILVLLMIFTQLFFSGLKEWIFGVKVENPLKNRYNKDL